MAETWTHAPAEVGALRAIRHVPGIAAFVFLTAAGAAHGGYFPGSWGWLTLAAGWAAILALLLDEDAGVGVLGGALIGLLGAYAVWSALSALWSVDATASLLEAQRNLVYVSAAVAAVLLARRHATSLVVAAWAAVSVLCGYALLTRLVPDRFGVYDAISGYRLSEPVGYWNSLGLFAMVGALLAGGFAARGRGPGRALAGATVPLLAATTYFTFSRGAWASLFAALLVLVAVDPRRLQALFWLALLAPASAVAVLLAARPAGLSTVGTPLAAQAQEGHRLAVELVAVAVATGAAALLWTLVERRLSARLAPHARRAEVALLAAVVVAAVVGFAVAGAPWTLAERGWHSFAGSAPAGGANLSGRLFNLSGSGRVVQWQVAWGVAKAHPFAGSGAGTYEHYWDLHRATPGKVRNVHNLYLEALATVGAVGLALLVAALAVPVVAAIRRRRTPLAPWLLAALAAYLVHAVVDWDWQLTGVTLPVAVAAAALVAPAETRGGRRALLGAAILLAAAGLWGIAAQTTLARIDSARTAGAAERAAHRAHDLQPWSTEPWSRLATIELRFGRAAQAQQAVRRALALDSLDWSLWLQLAETTVGPARTAALARAQTLNPHSPEIAAFVATQISISRLGAAK